jgi:hypothetical protein
MRFLSPGLLHLAWLLVIPVLLYLYRRQARRQTVSTLLFFRMLAVEHREAPWLRLLKRWLSLILTLALLALAVLLLARPVWRGGAGAETALVLVVDQSASMAATDPRGLSRLRAGRETLRPLLAESISGRPVSLVAAANRPEVLVARGLDDREFHRQFDALEPLPVEADSHAAWSAARRLAALDAAAAVWWLTDSPGSARDAVLAAGGDPDSIRWVDTALAAPVNAGITAFQVRPAPLEPDTVEAFVRVSAAAANPRAVTSRLEVEIGGRLSQLREVTLEPGASQSFTLSLEGLTGELLQARLVTAGDCLGLDDAAAAFLPAPQPLRIAWFGDGGGDPFAGIALRTLVESGRLELWRGVPDAWPPADEPDVFVFDGWLPTEWPPGKPAVLLAPPADAGALRAETLPDVLATAAGFRVALPEHPVLARLNAARQRLEIKPATRLQLPPGLQPLWMTDDEPLLAAGELDGHRLVVAAFRAADSPGLAFQPDFPLLIGNAVFWCAEGGAFGGLRLGRPGEALALDGAVEWVEWDGGRFVSRRETVHGWTLPRAIGAWRTEDGQSGAVVLNSAAETSLPKASGEPASPAVSAAPAMPRAATSWTAAEVLLLALLLLLLTESALFHLRNVH